MKTKHTPTPWQAWKPGLNEETFALGPHGKCPIVKTLGGDAKLNQANAQFITLACNHHEELVAALEMCRDFIKRAHGGEGMSEDERWSLLSGAASEADSLLTKLKGKP